MYKYTKKELQDFNKASETEIYMPNGLGGYISATACNNLFKKHNAYLTHSFNAPVDRYVLISKVSESLIIKGHKYNLDAQEYSDYKTLGNQYLEEFTYDVIPTYTYMVEGVKIIKRMAPCYMENGMGIHYEIQNPTDKTVQLALTPLMNYKFLGECQENVRTNEELYENMFIVDYGKVKTYIKVSDGTIVSRDHKYVMDIVPRFDQSTGDMRTDKGFTPVSIILNIKPNSYKELEFTAATKDLNLSSKEIIRSYEDRYKNLIDNANLNDKFANNLVISADSFISYRKSTGYKTILAGLPWFADWGRDTMISFTGALLVPKRFSEAREVLLSFKKYEKNGLIPNMFPTNNEAPLYNTVDASLWYFIACYNYIKYSGDKSFILDELYQTLYNIYYNYRNGTDFNIHMDTDGLIIAGSDLDQITWMDVRVGDVVVTPRHGKPVEINALWYNALMIMSELAESKGLDNTEFIELSKKVKESFNNKFYNKKEECLFDVIDNDDESVRPNQLFAVGLPFKILDRIIAEKVVLKAKEELYTKYGIRSLSIEDPRFKPKYEGKLWDRDMAYHMGTSWGWLMGIYIDSYLYVYDYSKEAIEYVKNIFLDINDHMHEYCLNGIAEIFDGKNPKISRGCSNQAWSVCEVLRAYYENFMLRGIKVNID